MVNKPDTATLPPSLAVASRVHEIAPFHVMELSKMAASLEQAGRSIIHMGIGQPDFGAAPAVMEAAASAIASGNTRYTSATGLPALRGAIARHYADRYAIEVDPSRIIVTAGASGALLLACAALIEPGAEVLMPDPSYPCNRHFVAAFEGRAKLVPCDALQRFQLSEASVKQHWTDTTVGVLLASPSNPTGTSIALDELQRIHAFVQKQGGFTIVDEIYLGLSYGETARSALSIGDDIVVINSFSKYFGMTGWRLGWLVVPPSLVGTVEKLAQNLFICASTLAQHAALACFTPEATLIFEDRRTEFQRRRDYLVPELEALGFKVPVMPDGAFYIYADCSGLSDDADRMTRDMLEEVGVVIVPGLDFGPATARTFVRISYATSMENLREAVARMRKFFSKNI